MKFGHDLAKVIGVSDPEWAPFFIQYKRLKKYINVIDGGSSEPIARSAPEVAFFRALRHELHKSSRFYKAAERVLEIRRERIAEALRQLRAGPGMGEKALSACVAYYRDLLLLENYAIINYCGFSKILKKHDKRTGYDTRARFMRVCVAPQPFTHYPRLLELIKEAEDMYRELAKAASAPEPEPEVQRSFIPREESEFIDAILNLRSQAVRMRAAEARDQSDDDDDA